MLFEINLSEQGKMNTEREEGKGGDWDISEKALFF